MPARTEVGILWKFYYIYFWASQWLPAQSHTHTQTHKNETKAMSKLDYNWLIWWRPVISLYELIEANEVSGL
jgi:hypothetical protein